MNFDFNTVALVGLSLFSLYFGYSYFKARFEDRMRAYTQRIDDVQTWIERENERIMDRIRTLDNRMSDLRFDYETRSSCKSKHASEKNYYNTEV
jgi:hypothetical protein